MLIGLSALYAGRLLLQKRKENLIFPRGLFQGKKDDKIRTFFDCVRKWRAGRAKPTKSTLRRMREGKYGLAGLRYSEFRDSKDDMSKFIAWTSSRLVDWTMLEEYANIVQAVDMEILRIAESGTQPESDHLHVPKSIVEGVRQYAQNGNIEPALFCQCFLYSLVLFDANPNLKAEPFREMFYQDADSLQRSFAILIRQRIKGRGKTVQDFAEKMFPPQPSVFPENQEPQGYLEPRKSFENYLYDSKRIIQPNFIRRLVETYHDFVLDEDQKSEGLKDVLPKIWNFVIQSAVIMDKMGELFAQNFRGIAKIYYDEFRQCADLAYRDFS